MDGAICRCMCGIAWGNMAARYGTVSNGGRCCAGRTLPGDRVIVGLLLASVYKSPDLLTQGMNVLVEGAGSPPSGQFCAFFRAVAVSGSPHPRVRRFGEGRMPGLPRQLQVSVSSDGKLWSSRRLAELTRRFPSDSTENCGRAPGRRHRTRLSHRVRRSGVRRCLRRNSASGDGGDRDGGGVKHVLGCHVVVYRCVIPEEDPGRHPADDHEDIRLLADG